jgi:hypothetical protein
MTAVLTETRRGGSGAGVGRPTRPTRPARPLVAPLALVAPRRLALLRPDMPMPDLGRPLTAGPRIAGPGVTDPRRRHGGAVYRRRRLLAGGLFLLSIAAALVLAQLVQAGTGGGPLTTTGAAAGPGAMTPAGATMYIVHPGDTLWSIAAAVAPGRDERPLVDQLAKETGGVSLYPGEAIVITAGR